MNNQNIEGFRLSPQQKNLWGLQQKLLEYNNKRELTNPYCCQAALLIQGKLNTDCLHNTLKEIVNRYDILRTNYQEIKGLKFPVQVINESLNFSWESHHPMIENPDNLDLTIEAIFEEHRTKLTKLDQISLFYSSLLTLSETEHILILSLPSLSADAQTINNLIQEIHQRNFFDGNSDEPVQYLQFSEWQNELLEEEEAAEGINYWQQQKWQSIPQLKLPFEKQSSQPFNPQIKTLNISSEITEKLKAIADSKNISLRNFLLTSWQILLSKLTGQTEIVINTAYSGRTYEELQEVLGLLTKSIPVYCSVTDPVTLEQLLMKTEQSVNAIRPWQEYYLPNENHPIAIAFEFQEYGKIEEGQEISLSLYQQYVCFDQFTVKLFVLLQQNNLTLQFYYDTNLVNSTDIDRIADSFQTLLINITKSPTAKIQELEILSDRQLHQLLIEFNQTTRNHPTVDYIHQKFEQQVQQTPHQIAVVYEDKKLTYSQLNERANQLAHHLIKLGIKPDNPVPIYANRSLEIVISMLGILKAGGAYLPIDSGLPLQGLKQRLQESKASLLITQQSLIKPQLLPNHQVIYLDKDWTTISQNSSQNPNIELTDKNLVYVIFTSGSTGQPKGVAIEHRQLLNYVHSILTKLDIPTNANFALVSTFGADLGHTCIFPTLCTGGCLHIISQERAANAKSLADYFQHHEIDCLKIVPSHLSALLSADPQASILPRQRLILGGEATPWTLIDQIRQKAPNCRIFNHYGPTETTVGATTFAIDQTLPHPTATVPIGRPLDNIQLYVLDEQRKPVPIGVPGELYIGGSGVARGYLHHPELTAERFIDNPFNHHTPDRLYKTGDRVRYLPDGNLEFLGRFDNQVKIHGFRIELGEIEAILSQHPQISQVAVIASKDNSGDRRLVAYIVPQNATTNETQWRSFLQEKLPDYMIPSIFVELKTMPLTQNGKIDRHNLPDRAIKNATNFVAPRTSIEVQLAEIWSEILGIKKIGIHDNFFALGGHSLQAIQLVSKISMMTQCDISVKFLFLKPTIAEFSQVIEQHQKKLSHSSNTMNIVTKIKPLPELSPFVKVENRSLLSLLITGKIAPIDCAALTYFPTLDFHYLEKIGWTPDTFIEEFCDNLPIVDSILETQLGRIAVISLPRFVYQLYQDQTDTVNVIIEALEIAKQIGAKTVSFTGLIPSATDYGKAVFQAISHRQDLPSITTGHGTTSATVVLSIEKILRLGNRYLEDQKVAFLGLGSVGMSTLRLMLKGLPHPQEIILCDVYHKLDHLEAIKEEIIKEFNFQGDVRLILSQRDVPQEIYQATLIIGATNVADILDITKIKPGTLIVDDSAPHCFAVEQAMQRLKNQGDILFTEGGILKPSEPIKRLVYLPNNINKIMTPEQRHEYLDRDPFNITGCVLSSLLSTRFNHLTPTIDLVRLETSLDHYKVLRQLGFQAADLCCSGDKLPSELIRKFTDSLESGVTTYPH